jgi:hypothetical protein
LDAFLKNIFRQRSGNEADGQQIQIVIPPEFHWVKDALQMRESPPPHHVRHPPFAEQDTQAGTQRPIPKAIGGKRACLSCASGTHPDFLESK